MARNPVLSPTHVDNDVLILEGVLQGVVAEGARYGLTHPRRDLLALTLQTLIRSCREGWEAALVAALRGVSAQYASQTSTETGRLSPPEGRDGDTHLSDPAPGLARRT